MVDEHEGREICLKIQNHILDAVELSGIMKEKGFMDAEEIIEELGAAYFWLENMRPVVENPWIPEELPDPVEWVDASVLRMK